MSVAGSRRQELSSLGKEVQEVGGAAKAGGRRPEAHRGTGRGSAKILGGTHHSTNCIINGIMSSFTRASCTRM